MIRALVLFLLTALPAAAQDFRDLLPDMPISELSRLGPPLFGDLSASTGGSAQFNLEDGSWLSVQHDGRKIRIIMAGAPRALVHGADRPRAFFRTSIEDVRSLAGSEGWFFEQEGFARIGSQITEWRLYCDLPAHPQIVLRLRPHDTEMELDRRTDHFGRPVVTPRSTLLAATLFDRPYLEETSGYISASRIDRPGAQPFQIPPHEAFPTLTP